MSDLNYRHVFLIACGCMMVPMFLIACILSIIKARRDRKAILARNEARRSSQPVATGAPNALEILANEVRMNRWHRRNSSIRSDHVQTLLRVASQSSSTEVAIEEKNNGYRQRKVGAEMNNFDIEASVLTTSRKGENSAHKLAPVESGSSSGDQNRKWREGVDNPGAFLQDENPKPMRRDVKDKSAGMIEMKSMGHDEFHEQENGAPPPYPKDDQYYVKPATLATFDSDVEPSPDKPARASRTSEAIKQEQNTRGDSETKHKPRKPPRRHSSRQRSEEDNSSNEIHTSITFSANDLAHDPAYDAVVSETRRKLESHDEPDLDPDTDTTRRNSCSAALTDDEDDVEVLPSRSRSADQLANSKKEKTKKSKKTHLEAEIGHPGKINKAFAQSNDTTIITKF